ncbi:alpha/beta hydrolase [Microbacterium awajiense]|uniref:Alpha/beta hydrolase n=1 Tax=Microbacterium awajiense TaxID=415214 RepID=A0ABP7B0K0_9MICO
MTRTPARRMRRLLAVVASVAVASIALSGCLYTLIPEDRPLSTESAAPDVSGIPTELLPFYSQTVVWSPCGDLECATITAPLDWDDPALGEIELALARQRALSGEAIGSLLFNPGGPGASAVDYIRTSMSAAVTPALEEAYDIVGFDTRGVGASSAVRCYDAAGMDAYLYDIPVNTRGSDAWEAELDARNAGFAAACEANSDGILAHVTTVDSARDMDLIRAVLGDSELHYLGYSYGTFLGATYAELYPDRVGRLVLDGAIDPSIPSIEVGEIQLSGFESALRAYLADCLQTSDCPFRGSVDEAAADLGALYARLDSTPLRASDGRMLGADAMVTATLLALYSEDTWQYLTIAIEDVLQGNPELAFLLADSYYGRLDGAYTDNSTEAFIAYNCMDYPDDTTPEDEAAAEARLAVEAPTFAPYSVGPDTCAAWPFPPTGTRGVLTADGAAPIVVIGTTNDPATPYEWAVSLADQLSSGVLVTREGEGHTGFNKGNACVDTAIEDYLIDGVVPTDGLVC